MLEGFKKRPKQQWFSKHAGMFWFLDAQESRQTDQLKKGEGTNISFGKKSFSQVFSSVLVHGIQWDIATIIPCLHVQNGNV